MDSHQPSLPQGINPASLAVQPQRTWKLGQRAAQAALVFLLCVGGFLSLFPSGRALTRGAFLLPALLSASETAPLALAGDGVRFKRLTLYPNTSRTVYLDIYEPTTPPPSFPGGREAIVDVPGAGDNRAVPQLVNLSQSLAREGIVVVNVGTPTLFDYRVSAQDGEAVVHAFKLMEHWPGVDPQRIGMITFSVGSLSTYVATADPRIRDRVAFVGVLGGYADGMSLLRAVGTRAQDVNGRMQPWQPISTTLYVLNRTMSNLFSPADQRLLQKAFPLETTLAPPLPARQQTQLSSVAAAYYHLLEGDEPGSVNRNLATLSPPLKTPLNRLSPLSIMNQIRAPIHLLHDRNDPAIPFTQAQEMAATLARLHHPYDLSAYSIFSHAEVQGNLTLQQKLGDGSRLLGVLTSILLVGS
ncbi:MAG TPA: hypothetical protein VF458_12860 [Ktedonobacteraceae bacterium]